MPMPKLFNAKLIFSIISSFLSSISSLIGKSKNTFVNPSQGIVLKSCGWEFISRLDNSLNTALFNAFNSSLSVTTGRSERLGLCLVLKIPFQIYQLTRARKVGLGFYQFQSE